MTGDVFADLEWRGLVHQVTDTELGARLANESITLYHGIDATADSLHVGNLLGVVTLQRLQRAGHRPIALLGGATSLIGDPSGKADERRMLSRDEVQANVEAIRSQLEAYITFGSRQPDAVLVNNADWLGELDVLRFLRDVGKHFPVNAMLAKESVKSRLAGGISFTEFSYMLMQAYDFLHLHDALRCRLQIGGSDQWGNITAGVDLVRRARGEEVSGLTWPLLTKADGTKFGKSEAGNVWLDPVKTSPYQFYQFWFRTDDRDVGRYLRLFTNLDQEEIEDLERATAERPQERGAQRTLAMEVGAAVHGREYTVDAAQASTALFGGDLRGLMTSTLSEVFSEAPSSTMPRSEISHGITLVDLLVRTGLDKSRTTARATIEQGGAYVNNQRDTDADRMLTEVDLVGSDTIVLRKGKRSYHVVRFR